MMRRREFVAMLGASVVPVAARGQNQAMPVIGFLSSASAEHDAGRLQGFRLGLSQAGYQEGRNVLLEYRWAAEQFDRLPALAAELASRQVDAIAVSGHVLGAVAAKAATKTIPIVFVNGVDPVAMGLVESLNRPGGNVTGISTLSIEMEPKLLELLHETMPTASTIGVLINPDNPNAAVQSRELDAAGRKMGVSVHALNASSEKDFENAFVRLAELRAGGLVIATDGVFISNSERLAALAVQHSVPAIFQFRSFPSAGGLMSYGGNLIDLYRQSALYIARILKGEKPSNLPVQQATKVELTINLKAARALGIDVPLPLIGRADEVIE